MFHINLPFVHIEDGKPVAAIKPIDLDRNESTEVYDHGGMWVQRFERLAERRQLPPQMIVPVRLPINQQRLAADQVVKELTHAGVKVVAFDDPDRIRELASA